MYYNYTEVVMQMCMYIISVYIHLHFYTHTVHMYACMYICQCRLIYTISLLNYKNVQVLTYKHVYTQYVDLLGMYCTCPPM